MPLKLFVRSDPIYDYVIDSRRVSQVIIFHHPICRIKVTLTSSGIERTMEVINPGIFCSVRKVRLSMPKMSTIYAISCFCPAFDPQLSFIHVLTKRQTEVEWSDKMTQLPQQGNLASEYFWWPDPPPLDTCRHMHTWAPTHFDLLLQEVLVIVTSSS